MYDKLQNFGHFLLNKIYEVISERVKLTTFINTLVTHDFSLKRVNFFEVITGAKLFKLYFCQI